MITAILSIIMIIFLIVHFIYQYKMLSKGDFKNGEISSNLL